MVRYAAALARHIVHLAAIAALSLSPRTVVLGIVLLFTMFLWAVTVAPPLVSFALTAALAVGWCAWLQGHPEVPKELANGSRVQAALDTSGWTVHVLATTPEGTRCALETARRLTQGVAGQVALFVPRLTTFAAPFDASSGERAAMVDAYQAIAADVGVHVTTLFCVCKRLDDVVHQLLGTSGLVIVGGRRRAWWPSREERLVDRLSGEGYAAVFAQIGAHPKRAWASTVRF